MRVNRSKPFMGAKSVFSEGFSDRAPWWGGDLQTLRNVFLPPTFNTSGVSERLEFETLDDSGDKLIGTLDTPTGSVSGPLILLIHGLTGDQDSPYMRNTSRLHTALSRRVLRLNLRGAGPSRQVAEGFYYGGCVDDIYAVLSGLPKCLRDDGVFAIGYSLGGNILINVLGQSWAAEMLVGAATVSAPLVPADAARQLMKPRNAVYHRNLVHNMKAAFLRPNAELSASERNAIKTARSVYQLDDLFTAPRNGYRDVNDYYAQTAGARFVHRLAVPTLLIHARNNPWIPVSPYEDPRVSRATNAHLMITNSGGHVGFHERGFPETRFDRAIEAFLTN